MKKILSAAAVSAAFAAAPAFAQVSHVYLGAGVGIANTDSSEFSWKILLLPAGARAGAARRARPERLSRLERALESHEASVRVAQLNFREGKSARPFYRASIARMKSASRLPASSG